MEEPEITPTKILEEEGIPGLGQGKEARKQNTETNKTAPTSPFMST